MRVPSVRLRLWVAMVTVAISAGVMAEIGQRRGRLARLSTAHLESANACFDRIGRICKDGETPQSMEAFYRKQGVVAWQDYQTAEHHLRLYHHFWEAADRRWLPMLSPLPPLVALRETQTIAEWAVEALLELTPLLCVGVLLLTLRSDRRCPKRMR